MNNEIFYLVIIGLTVLVTARFVFPALFDKKDKSPVKASNFRLKIK